MTGEKENTRRAEWKTCLIPMKQPHIYYNQENKNAVIMAVQLFVGYNKKVVVVHKTFIRITKLWQLE